MAAVTAVAGGRGHLTDTVSLGSGELLDRRGQPLPLAELGALWPLGGWQEAQPLVGGKNEHVRLTTGDGVFFLRRSYRSKPLEELRRQLALMRWLAEGGLPVPEVAVTTRGRDHAEVDGRLYTVTRALIGAPYDDDSPGHLRELGRTLARYHHLVRGLPAPGGEVAVLAELEARAEVPGEPALTEQARRVVVGLRALLPRLPRCVVHGGARRGSLLFAGDELAGVLDFDSARADVRVHDLAVAAHDVGKVYTQVGAADHKVALDVGRVRGLLTGYAAGGGSLTPAEAEALPLLVEAKRLKRCLGRLHRHHAGEPLSGNDLAKIELERSRLRWLGQHRDELAGACSGAIG